MRQIHPATKNDRMWYIASSANARSHGPRLLSRSSLFICFLMNADEMIDAKRPLASVLLVSLAIKIVEFATKRQERAQILLRWLSARKIREFQQNLICATMKIRTPKSLFVYLMRDTSARAAWQFSCYTFIIQKLSQTKSERRQICSVANELQWRRRRRRRQQRQMHRNDAKPNGSARSPLLVWHSDSTSANSHVAA